MKRIHTACYLLLCFLMLATPAAANPKLASLFSDHMVLQRGAPVPIWGTAEPGAAVTVSFADQVHRTQADAKGRWRIELKPLSASNQPRTLKLGDDDAPTVAVQDVLVGDVWVGSGQSNMAGRVASYAKNDATLAALAARGTFPAMRLLQSGPSPSWREADATSVAQFSAILFAFGERLQRELDVPIGLMLGAVGGTPSGSWIPPATYASSAKCQASVAEFAKTYDHAAAMRQFEARLAAWNRRAATAKAAGKKARGRAPAPPKQPGESSRGGRIGGLYDRFIEPVAGFRIRGVLWDQGEARSGIIGIDQYTLMSELIRGWREAWGQGDFPFLFVQKPSGGGTAFSPEDPITRNGDPLIKNLPDIGQLGNGGADRYLYVRLMRDNSKAYMVPASDLGSGIHPTNKWGYGNRAAEVALSQVYGQDIQAYGPTFRRLQIETAADKSVRVIVEFDHVGQGLVAAHGLPLQGFALAGEDGLWHWASAEIEGDTVVLSSDQLSNPQRARYAYAQKRAWANLFNRDGRPAICFDSAE